MPVKYKPTTNVLQRGSKKRVIEHHYMKAQSLKELLECYNNDNTKPKLRPILLVMFVAKISLKLMDPENP